MRIFLVPALFFLIAAPAAASAEKSALAPPTVVGSGQTVADHEESATESAPNLSDTLATPDSSSVDIRSYQRKDGARITEYGPKGAVYKIKVEPAGDLPAYYLYRNERGQFERKHAGGSVVISPATWTLKEF